MSLLNGNYTYILDISSLNLNDIIKFSFYAMDSAGNIKWKNNGALNYSIQIYDPEPRLYWILPPFVINEFGGGNYTWAEAVLQPWCNGSGTYNDPYVIKNVTINGGGASNCIEIRNSNVYFIINNCTLYNSGTGIGFAGIKLYRTHNSTLINNNCSFDNYYGMLLFESINNTISGNTLNNNYNSGLALFSSHNNTISDNKDTLSYNGVYGMFLEQSDNNTISGNKIQYNTIGIYLNQSNWNRIINNDLFFNDNPIIEENCIFNFFINNLYETGYASGGSGGGGGGTKTIQQTDFTIIIAILITFAILGITGAILYAKSKAKRRPDALKQKKEKRQVAQRQEGKKSVKKVEPPKSKKIEKADIITQTSIPKKPKLIKIAKEKIPKSSEVKADSIKKVPLTMPQITKLKRKKLGKPSKTYNISVMRGGDWAIEENQSVFTYKVKMKNESKYVISNIQVVITSILPGLELISEQVVNFSDLNIGSFVSPSFKFAATESCVGNKIEGLINFRDYKGKSRTIQIKPFEIKYVCNLLIPKSISEQKYEQNTVLMEEKKMVFDCNLPPYELEKELKKILQNNNFFLLDKVPESQDADFRKLKGYAEGKYDKKDVALKLFMQKLTLNTSKLVIRAMSDREEKIIDLLKDISMKCNAIKIAPEYSGPLEITCKNCDYTIILTSDLKARDTIYCEKCGKKIKIP